MARPNLYLRNKKCVCGRKETGRVDYIFLTTLYEKLKKITFSNISKVILSGFWPSDHGSRYIYISSKNISTLLHILHFFSQKMSDIWGPGILLYLYFPSRISLINKIR